MDERSFYVESNTAKAAELNCPHCRTTATYELRWILRRKKDRLPGHADERDRARFAKAQSYMVLQDDKVACSNLQCRKRFDVSGIKTMAFLSPEQEQELAAQQPQRADRQDRRQGNRQDNRQNNRKRPRQKAGGRGQQDGNRNTKQGGNRSGSQKWRPQKKKKKKRPEVYFPSDYVNYRP